jgi:hypothetical protein
MTLDLSRPDAEQLRAALNDIAALAHATPAPTASAELIDLISGLRRRTARRRAVAVAAASALAFGGTSVAAAETGTLPPKVQDVVANFADEHLPVRLPHADEVKVKPVKPTNPPYDAPGHVRNKPKKAKPVNSAAPGQMQKLTKPNPRLPGPARPADPGSRGKAKAADAKASHVHKAKKK